MKRILFLLGLLVALAVTAFLFRNAIASFAVVRGVKSVTGLRLGLERMNIGADGSSVQVQGVRLYNPSGYPDDTMMRMPELYVDYDLAGLLRGKVRLKEVRVDVQEFLVERNQKGELNLDSLKVVRQEKSGDPGKKQENREPSPIRIDLLRLKIGKVVFKDYSRGSTPQVREFPLNLDERYENVQNPQAVVSLIVVKALTNTALSGLLDFRMESLKSIAEQGIGGAAGIAGGILNQTLTGGRAAGSAASGAVQDAASVLGGIFSKKEEKEQ